MLRFDLLLEDGFLVEQAAHALVVDDVGVDDLGDIVGLHLDVKDVVGEDLDDGALFAEPEAPGGGCPHDAAQPFLGDELLEVGHDFLALGRVAARAAAHQDQAAGALARAQVDPAVEQRLEARVCAEQLLIGSNRLWFTDK